MSERSNAPAAGPLGRLIGSAGDLLASLLTIGRTRLELLTVELQLELRRIAELLVLAFVALLAGGMGLLMGGLSIIFAFWDTHRLLAAGLVTATFFALAALAVFLLARRVRDRPRALDGTLSELARDAEQLRGRG
jgi:uncharacterized membrane protein YqjE